MGNKKWLFALPAILVLFTQCKKDITGLFPKLASKPPVPLIKTYTNSQGNVSYLYEYQYNEKGDLSEMILEANTRTRYNYYPGSILIINSNLDGTIINYAESVTLNEYGYCTVSTSPSIPGRLSVYNITKEGQQLEVTSNSNGPQFYLTSKTYYNKEGLVDSLVGFKNNQWYYTSIIEDYDKTKPFTLGNKNRGQRFFGDTYKHPFRKSTWRELLSNNTIATSVSSIEYKYDDQNRIIERKLTNLSTNNSRTETYTYY